MERWARPPESREQLVLFPTRLDDAVAAGHVVRRLDEILSRLDWSAWESHYNLRRGQPPIHPRVLASVLLYGLLTRIRSSRGLEEALRVRLDFRWLAEGQTIDHTTLSVFRRRHPDALKQLFVQIGLVARELGLLTLERLAYDGTRIRANNRRSGTRTPEELHHARKELAAKFTELEGRIAQADAQDDEAERLVDSDAATLPARLQETAQRLATIDAALAELKRIEAAGQTLPGRLPLTDPQSRVAPNKEGGFAPNFTPLSTVDVSSGLIVGCDVLSSTNEDAALVGQLEQVRRDFGLEHPVPEVLADGMMSSGATLAALAERGVTLYSPSKQADPTTNPARRSDPSQPVAAEQVDQLPSRTQRARSGERVTEFTKDAFVYDATRDGYWCPQGQLLPLKTTGTEKLASGTQVRWRYQAEASTCAACPLRARCLKPGAVRREISRFEHDGLVEQLSQRMATKEGQAKYAQRRHAAERPFAHIKQQFGARQFLLRGLERVRQEWCWLASAFNLSRLLSLLDPARLTNMTQAMTEAMTTDRQPVTRARRNTGPPVFAGATLPFNHSP